MTQPSQRQQPLILDPDPAHFTGEIMDAPAPAAHTELVTRPAAAVTHRAATPDLLLEMALNQNADLDRLERLMKMKAEWDAGNARMAFIEAMAEFKKNAPVLIKDKLVSFGNTKYKHAELDQVAGKIGAALSAVGISHRWTIHQEPGLIRVACILTHIQGHSETVTMEGAPDTSGQKNAIQAQASAVSYLQRYTLLSATGMATGEADNDGRGAAPAKAAMPELDKELGFIKVAKTMADLQETANAAYKRAGAAGDKAAQAAIIEAKDKRKAELAGGAK